MAPRKGCRGSAPSSSPALSAPEHRVTRCAGVRLSDRVLRVSRTLVPARPGRGRCWHGGQGRDAGIWSRTAQQSPPPPHSASRIPPSFATSATTTRPRRSRCSPCWPAHRSGRRNHRPGSMRSSGARPAGPRATGGSTRQSCGSGARPCGPSRGKSAPVRRRCCATCGGARTGRVISMTARTCGRLGSACESGRAAGLACPASRPGAGCLTAAVPGRRLSRRATIRKAP